MATMLQISNTGVDGTEIFLRAASGDAEDSSLLGSYALSLDK
jgi:hypothetical protein